MAQEVADYFRAKNGIRYKDLFTRDELRMRLRLSQHLNTVDTLKIGTDPALQSTGHRQNQFLNILFCPIK